MEDFKFLTHTEENGGECVQTIDARELHNKLNIDTKFSSWITRRIEEYGFLDGEDFFPILGKNTIVQQGRPATDYHITYDMAKELCMLEHSEKGKEFRRYFIKIEKEYRAASLPTLPNQNFPLLKNTLSDCMDIARILGFDGNQAKLSAVSAAKQITGIDALALLGVDLVSERKTTIYTPTQLGSEFIDNLTAQQVNIRLRDAGFQVKIGDQWTPTEDGKKYCEVLDTGKRHKTDSAPVKQVKWYEAVVEFITDESVYNNEQKKITGDE